jgi:hypothetical protein
MKLSQKILIAILLFCFGLLPVRGLSNGNQKERPNIIVILVDDLGYGDLSIQGGKDIRTPNIDKLFEKGYTSRIFIPIVLYVLPPVQVYLQVAYH